MMRRRGWICVLAWTMAVVPPVLADDRPWMGEAAIRKDLVGHKLAGTYPSGVTWSEEIRQDGSTDYQEAGLRSRGNWTLDGQQFCFTYVDMLPGGCFRMIKLGSNCYELYIQRDAAAEAEPEPPGEGIAWNGRMWRATEPATCEEKPSV